MPGKRDCIKPTSSTATPMVAADSKTPIALSNKNVTPMIEQPATELRKLAADTINLAYHCEAKKDKNALDYFSLAQTFLKRISDAQKTDADQYDIEGLGVYIDSLRQGTSISHLGLLNQHPRMRSFNIKLFLLVGRERIKNGHWDNAKSCAVSALQQLREIKQHTALETEQQAEAVDMFHKCESQTASLTAASALSSIAKANTDNEKTAIDAVIRALKQRIGLCFVGIDQTVTEIKKSKNPKILRQLENTQSSVEIVRARVQESNDVKALRELSTRLQAISSALDGVLVIVKKEKPAAVKPVKHKKAIPSDSNAAQLENKSVSLVCLTQTAPPATAAGTSVAQPTEVKTSQAVTHFFATAPATAAVVRSAPAATAAPPPVEVNHSVIIPAASDVKADARTIFMVSEEKKVKEEIKQCFAKISDLIGIEVINDKFFMDDSKGFAKKYNYSSGYSYVLAFTLEYKCFEIVCLKPYLDSTKESISLERLNVILRDFKHKKNDLERIQKALIDGEAQNAKNLETQQPSTQQAPVLRPF